MKVYPKLISYYKPEYKRVFELEEITDNSYYMFSGNGMPSLYNKIQPSLSDIAEFNQSHDEKIDELVVCLDTDYYGDESQTYFKISQEFAKCDRADDTGLVVIMQTNCLETWFLGNRAVYPQTYSENFRDYAKHYDVSSEDPEKMVSPSSDVSIGTYSKQYLKKMLNEKGMTYSVSNVKNVATHEYISEIESRFRETGHISSYRHLKYLLDKM